MTKRQLQDRESMRLNLLFSDQDTKVIYHVKGELPIS